MDNNEEQNIKQKAGLLPRQKVNSAFQSLDGNDKMRMSRV